jgi:hypothetical protein
VNKVRRLASLSAPEWLVLLQAAALLAFTRIGLNVFGYRRCRAILHGATPASDPSAIRQDPDQSRQIARLVNAAANALWPLHTTCLVRSLVLEHLLVRQGIACDLRFGGQLGPDGLKAHAWIECAGRSLETGGQEKPFATFEPIAIAATFAGGHGS